MNDNNERNLKRTKPKETDKILQKIKRVTAECQKAWDPDPSDEELKLSNNEMEFSNTEMQCTSASEINCDCGPDLERIERSLIELTKKVENLQAENYCQVEVVVETLAEQTALLNNIKINNTSKPIAEPPLCKKFPVPTVAELEILENDINCLNRDQYLESVCNLIRKGGIIRNIRNVFSNEVVMESNVNGHKGKNRLTDHTQFFAILIEAISSVSGTEENEAINQLRTAVHMQKNRIHYAATYRKKSAKKPPHSE